MKIMTAEHDLDPVVELEQLRRAVASRPTINLAKGIIMGLRRCDEDTASAELREVARDTNHPVSLLAERLVELAGQSAQTLDASHIAGASQRGRSSPTYVVIVTWLRDMGPYRPYRRLWGRRPVRPKPSRASHI